MDFVSEVIKQYPHLTKEDAERFVERAKFFYYAIQYPYEPSADDISRPILYFKDRMWVLEACQELIQRQGFDNAIGYRENGVSWTFKSEKLSQELIDKIIPIGGCPIK